MNFKKDAPIIGLIGGTLTTAAGFPQAWTIFTTNDTSGVSPSMCIILITGEIVWAIYALILGLPTLLFFCFLTVLVWGYVLYKALLNDSMV